MRAPESRPHVITSGLPDPGPVAPASPVEPKVRLLDAAPTTGLRRATLSGGLATGLAQATQFVLQIGAIAVLSRLLGPDAFGVVAMVATIGGLMQTLTDAGLGTATVQRAQITHGQVSNLFWVNAAIATLLAGALVALAPALAWFYREPRLIPVAVALAPMFLLNGLAVQHIALLRRQMRYNVLAAIPIVSTLAGVLLAIVMARLNASYWSLVGMQLTTSLFACVLAWLLTEWRPQLPARGRGTGPLVSFGLKLAFGNSIWTLAKSADGVLVGRVWGVDALGLYSRGGTLMLRPLDQIMAPLDGLIVPALSRMQAEPERFRRVAFELFDLVAMMSMVGSATLLALSYPLTLLVLGPRWADAAPIFAAFTFVALYVPTSNVASWLLTSQGRGADVMRFAAVTSAMTVMALLVGVQFGPLGVAIAYASAGMMVQLPLAYYTVGRSGSIRTSELWRRLLSHAPLWFIVVAVCTGVRLAMIDAPHIVQVGAASVAGLSSAAAFILAFPGNRRLLRSIRENVKFGA
jgi:O-antigen/teichoic acid export membrane protein